ncbi:MAG: glycosyltransferase family 4 protein, partial [Candidatus Aenigmatarchaeota archaeon]
SNVYQFLVATIAKISVQTKLVLHVTDFEEFFVFKNIKSPVGIIKSIFKTIVVKLFPLISDGITIISPNLKEYVLKTKAKKKHLIHILLPYTPKNYFSVSKKYMKKLKKDKFWFLFFGSISKFQGIEEIIKSFLKADIKNTQLIIIGEGPLKNHLEAKYKHNKNIIFLKSLNRKELFCFCKLSDCILCYFPFEAINELRLPAKLRESMFFGKPIITTNIGFCKLLSNTAVLKVRFNEKALTEAMRKVYYNKSLRQRLSQEIKKEFKKWFQNENNIYNLLLFYEIISTNFYHVFKNSLKNL